MVLIALFSCKENNEARKPKKQITIEENDVDMKRNLDKYVSFKLTSDLSILTENERKMLPILIKAAEKMNKLFWFEAYGDKIALLETELEKVKVETGKLHAQIKEKETTISKLENNVKLLKKELGN